MADDLWPASRSIDGEGVRESSSSSSSLMLIKFEWLFLRIRVAEPSRPSKQARAAERLTRLVSDLIEREADEGDVDVTVRTDWPRARIGESGSGCSAIRNERRIG